MPTTTLYIDLMSQPSRACYILCKKFNLPVRIQMIRLDKGEHKRPEYLAINPLGKVPFLVDGDLHLPESAAIMAYLADLHQLPDAWHPSTTTATTTVPSGSSSSSSIEARRAGLARRATYMAAAHWQHLSMRRGCMTLAFFTVIGPRVFNVPASEPIAKQGLQILRQALQDLESFWLDGGKRPFMTGDEVSTPDVLCCCELEQLNMMVAAPTWPQLEQLLAPHPAVRAWMAAVRRDVGPGVYDEAHSKLRAAVQRLAAATAAAAAAAGSGTQPGGSADARAAPRL